MEDADLILRRRRDRAKVAQRSFRHRQAAKTAESKRCQERLTGLLKEIIVAYQSSDQQELSNVVARATHELGLKAGSGDAPQSKAPATENVLCDPPSASSNEISGSVSSTTSLDTPKERSGRFSPRLDYAVPAVDPDRFGKIFDPPADIQPYVGAGEHTLAGRITWACLDQARIKLRDALRYQCRRHSPPEAYGPVIDGEVDCESRAFSHWQRAVGHSKPLEDLVYMNELLEARLEYRRLGFMRHRTDVSSFFGLTKEGERPPNRNGTDEAHRQLVEGQVLHGLMSRGVNLNEHWTALEVEAYVRDRMGGRRFTALQSILRNAGKQTTLGKQHAVEVHATEMLASSLSGRATCFGDGPRWYASDVRLLIDTWLPEVSDNLLIEV